MKKRALLFALFYLSYLNYQQRTALEREPLIVAPSVFHTPYIIHEAIPKDYQYFYHDGLKPGSSKYLGKYKWCDSLRIPQDIRKNEERPSDIEYDFLWKGKNEMFRTDGLQLVPDYNSTIFYSTEEAGSRYGEFVWTYYPIYLVNETQETRFFVLNRDHVFALQEAEEPLAVHPDTWFPIDYNRQDFSGEGQRAIKIYPGEFVLLIMPRYMGPIDTRLRVRLYNGDNIIVSTSYPGHIYYNQFLTLPGTPLHTVIQENDVRYIPWMFLGALPMKDQYPMRERVRT